MDYSFNVQVAKRYGVEEAVFLHNLYWWIFKNEANGRHYHEGKTWTYNSQAAFAKLFPFWSRYQVQRIIKKLQANGALLVGNFNPDQRDRTNWYALSDDVLEIYGETSNMQDAKSQHEWREITPPLPDINTDSKQSCSGSYAREELAEISASYEQNIGGPIPRAAFDEAAAFVEDGLPPQLVCRAIQEAAVQGKRSWSYARAILRRCKQEGIKSTAAFEHGLRSNAPRAAASPAAQESFEARMARLADEMTGGAL